MSRERTAILIEKLTGAQGGGHILRRRMASETTILRHRWLVRSSSVSAGKVCSCSKPRPLCSASPSSAVNWLSRRQRP